VLAAPRDDGDRGLGAESPAGDIEAVDAVVADLTGPPVPEPVPVVVEVVAHEGAVGGGPLPHLVIDSVRDRAGRAVADGFSLLMDPRARHADLAELARLDAGDRL